MAVHRLQRVRGTEQTRRALSAFPPKVQREVRKAIARVATKALQAAKSALPQDRTGMLRRSMGKKLGVDRKGNPYGLVGPRRGFKVTLATTGKKTTATFLAAKKSGKVVTIRRLRVRKTRTVSPTQYSHLVVGGTKRSRKRDFLAPARAVVRSTLPGELAASITAMRAV